MSPGTAPRPLLVDRPVLNSPYEEPTSYWLYEQRQPQQMSGRRPAGYYFRTRRRDPGAQLTLLTDEQFVELEQVNQLRHRVAEWRKDGYPGVTPITRKLLEHWNQEDREPRLFFCQLEAAETIIWLAEVSGKAGPRVQVPQDEVVDAEGQAKGYEPLRRYGCKMATGAGKTVVMGMVAAWSILNKVQAPSDRRFSHTILAVCPGLTIRERLQVLHPSNPGNYYEEFDLVPPGMMEQLGAGKVFVTNWHDFLVRDDSKRRGVVQRGKESDDAFCRRVLHELGAAKNILVFNDEAHHAYRPPALDDEDALDGLTGEEKREARAKREQATVWIRGLDRINAVRRINFCLDLSATPFYISGSGHEEGTPFPWVVSDFGLVDAIESGLVKIPRVPVDDNTGQAIPKYFALWRWINDRLEEVDPASAGARRRKPKPEAVLREADGALQQLAGLWKESLDQFERAGFQTPPAMIVVCDNTNLSQVFYEHISGEVTRKDEDGKTRTAFGNGHVFPDFLQNSETHQPTMRIDSKLIRDAENATDGKKTGDELRHKVSTVGKVGMAGEQVRCVVSVSMLTEGWDARNVKQILGLRAFDSQLLCEQVVGRGLRRVSYEIDPETGLFPEEYVDVYGVPFEVIPIKKKPELAPDTEKEKTLVRALPERLALQIEFPRVEGYVYKIGERVTADVDSIPPIEIDRELEPTESIVRPKAWAEGGPPGLVGPGETVTQTRAEYYEQVRMQRIEYDIAHRVTEALLTGQGHDGFQLKAAHIIFPQVLRIVREFLRTRVEYRGANPKEVGVERYRQLAVKRLLVAIRPDEEHDEIPLLPRVERFRPKGSTAQVEFSTVKPCRETIKSHVSHVVLDSEVWEGSAAAELEASDVVVSYVKNERLGFLIPYEWEEKPHNYWPDFIVRLTNGLNLIIEIKGRETEQDRQKYAAAQRWVSAVNNDGRFGTWAFEVCRAPGTVGQCLRELVE